MENLLQTFKPDKSEKQKKNYLWNKNFGYNCFLFPLFFSCRQECEEISDERDYMYKVHATNHRAYDNAP